MPGAMLIRLWVSKEMSGPLPWDLPCRAHRHGAGALARLCSPEWKQRVVWVHLAATGPKLHGPQVPAKHGAGQCPASGSGSHPVCSASPLQTPHLPCCGAHMPSLLLRPPLLPFPSAPLLPTSPVLCPRGLEQRTLGKPKRLGPGQGRLVLGLFPPQSRAAAQPGKTSHPYPPGDRNGLHTLTPAHEGGPLLVAARATPLPQN